PVVVQDPPVAAFQPSPGVAFPCSPDVILSCHASSLPRILARLGRAALDGRGELWTGPHLWIWAYPGFMTARETTTFTHRFRMAMGARLREKVAGPEGAERAQEIWGAAGPRWFAPGEPIRRVHDDASMFIGGITAL